MRLLVLLAALACGACTSVCARTWETTTTVGRTWYGPEYTQSATIGGGIGRTECKK